MANVGRGGARSSRLGEPLALGSPPDPELLSRPARALPPGAFSRRRGPGPTLTARGTRHGTPETSTALWANVSRAGSARV